MHGQGQIREQKRTTKKVVGFHNHSRLLTMFECTAARFHIIMCKFNLLLLRASLICDARTLAFPKEWINGTSNYSNNNENNRNTSLQLIIRLPEKSSIQSEKYTNTTTWN